MKSFSQFVDEAFSRAVQQATRMGLRPDGHGGYYDGKGEFIAKNVQGRLVFYNKRQRLGQDPAQTPKEKLLSISTPENTPPITEEELREKYISGEIFNQGDIVESNITGMIGKIIRRGTNHLICVTEDQQMFKSWIKDVKEYTEVEMNRKMRQPGKPNTLIGTKGYFKYAAQQTPGAIGTGKENLQKGGKAYSENFINKYIKKESGKI
jgi:hypothetical protein